MRTATRRWAPLLAAAALALTAPVLGAPGAAHAAACSASSGVTVVVGSTVGCAPGDPSSALAALQAAGHSTVMVRQFPAALCRIDGAPSSDACVVMPPASAYWSLWTARRGGSWTFASSAVTSVDPAPGTVVGLAFGAGSPPGVAPPAATVLPPPRPTPQRTTAPRPTTISTPSHRAGTATHPGSTGSHPSSAAAPGSSPSSPGATTPTSVAGAGPATLGTVAAASRTTPVAGSGPLPLAAGGGLVLALAGATAYVLARRRRG